MSIDFHKKMCYNNKVSSRGDGVKLGAGQGKVLLVNVRMNIE